MNELIDTQDQSASSLALTNAREMKEVEGQIIMAKKFPRDIIAAMQRIKDSCKRKKLADKAVYLYPKAGQVITGPSIRLAEVIAQAYGNISFGVREISLENGESLIEAFAWDLESNVRQSKCFKVPHVRYSKNYGNKKLTDPRDIYEAVANQGARRLRSCILGVIPMDIIEEAVDECSRTMANQNNEPIADRIIKMLNSFSDKFQVSKEMLEKRIGHTLEETSEDELVELRKIFNSLKENMTKRSDWFDFKIKESSNQADALNNLSNSKQSVETEIVIDKEMTDQEKAFSDMGNMLDD